MALLAKFGRVLLVPTRSVVTPLVGQQKSGGDGGHRSGRTWKILSFTVAVPGVAVCMMNAYLRRTKHPHEQPEFIPYKHLRIRSKPFPWGDGSRTLFHNPHVNALPTGYEEP